ncbi:RagB/SusD family nutrient uptake outer membrane protein [Mucilaginibacter lappiensis]|uniref:SusD family protein n=1 Tax=Mucilaginibacter lappiensis TaxID=354630 RepID=A0A841JKC2_9SPHI|nr:RagB/SusD family nutrient uptake outer membrane protein [Mucilaginibacter lappiensis]MBB6131633.1 hypothetical protein [Mucilaginibacter lappiensis]
MKITLQQHKITSRLKDMSGRKKTNAAFTVRLALVVLIGIVPLSGCNKYLDQQPDNRTDLNTPDKVSQLLTSAYPDRDYITFCEAMSDNSADRGFPSKANLLPNENAFLYKDYTSTDDGSPDVYWNACYRAIAAANQALQVCNTAANPAQYSAYKGEALLARAYSHFMLVSLFAKTYNPVTATTDPGIPYITEPETVLLKKYDRKTVAYVYDMIEKDLLAGIPLINDNAYKVPAYRFTITAAHAFASRFYLFKQQYDKVIQQADLAIPTSAILGYLRPWNTVYLASSFNTVKAMYTKADQKANLLLATTESIWARGLSQDRYGLTYNIVSATLNHSIVVSGEWAPYQLQYGNQQLIVPKFLENFININTNTGNLYNYIPLLSAEEVLFNKAEANVATGNFADAITALNIYLSTRIKNYDPTTNLLTIDNALKFYNVTDTKAALTQTILDFKRVEFMQEGFRWFDILRYKIPVTHIDKDNNIIKLGPDDPRRVIQIPAPAQKTAGLTPNPR